MNIPKGSDQPNAPRVQVDWRTYFKEFELAHGGNPVLHGNRLLYHDGWTYSATDEAGPEWPPPEDEDERNSLIKVYWVKRRKIVQAELSALEKVAKGLDVMQQGKSLPIQYTVRTTNEEGKAETQRRSHRGGFQGDRINWLRQDVKRCDEEIEKRQAKVHA